MARSTRISGIPVISNPEFHGTRRVESRGCFSVLHVFYSCATPVRADTGSTILPDLAESAKPVRNRSDASWYEKPDACNQWLNNPEYIIAKKTRLARACSTTRFVKDPTKSDSGRKNSGNCRYWRHRRSPCRRSFHFFDL